MSSPIYKFLYRTLTDALLSVMFKVIKMRNLLYRIGLLGLVVLILMPSIRANAQADLSGRGPNERITETAPPKAAGERSYPLEQKTKALLKEKTPENGQAPGSPRQVNVTKIPEEVGSGSQDQSDDQQQSQSDDQQQAQNDSAQADEQAQAEENKASGQSSGDDNSGKGYGCSARP